MDTRMSTWEHVDHLALAERLAPVAEAVSTTVDEGSGRRALVVAAGTGSLADQLARRGWQVTATDGTRISVQHGRTVTYLGGLGVDWAEAELARQPVEDGSQALVASLFGITFAADPVAALAEAARVLRPDGRLVVTVWPDGGLVAGMAAAMAPFLPAEHGSGPQEVWGSQTKRAALLEPRFHEVHVAHRSLPIDFPSAAHARRWLEASSPAHVAAVAAAGERGTALMDAVEAFLAAQAGPDGAVRTQAEYQVVSASLAPVGAEAADAVGPVAAGRGGRR
jgi:SAM-dependent methyltransferase